MSADGAPGHPQRSEPIAAGPDNDRVSLSGDIARCIGVEAAAALARDFGGRRVYIPMAPSVRDQIAKSIGLAAAARLARLFGGNRVVVPAHPDRALRRKQICKLRARGLSVSRIARTTGCTERYVYRVLSETRRG